MENYSVEYTGQKLRELCQRAGKVYYRCRTNAIQWYPGCEKGWAVVKAADCDNAKLILDTWHWVRADQPVDISVLADVPADKVVSIQIKRCMGKTICNHDFKGRIYA